MVREDTILSQFIRSKTSFQTNLDCVQNFPPKMWSGEGMEGKGREEKGGEGREEKGGEGREERGGKGGWSLHNGHTNYANWFLV